jgi:putative solute:sodium symporter small subunit
MNKAQEYWRTNLKLVVGCLIVWFIVSFGAGILFHDVLNNIQIGGYKLGFWFAQQGSMYIFIALIFFYSIRMNKIDRKFGVEEEEGD